MRVDTPALVFLSQTTVDHVDGLSRAPWQFFAFLVLIGGTAGIAKLWTVIGEYIKDKREVAKRAADEEKLRRDAKVQAEIEQVQALTLMARDVPRQFDVMTKTFDAALSKIGETNSIMSKRLDENTNEQRALRAEVHELKDELRSDTRELVQAIARQLGTQTSRDETNSSGVRRLSSPGQASQAQTA